MRTIQVDDATYEKIKSELPVDQAGDVSELDDFVGAQLFIRTVTYHMTGRVVKRTGNLLELEDAAWIADSGRFADAIKTGELSEVEPVGRAWISLGARIEGAATTQEGDRG
jgi:hypothetical protein